MSVAVARSDKTQMTMVSLAHLCSGLMLAAGREANCNRELNVIWLNFTFMTAGEMQVVRRFYEMPIDLSKFVCARFCTCCPHGAAFRLVRNQLNIASPRYEFWEFADFQADLFVVFLKNGFIKRVGGVMCIPRTQKHFFDYLTPHDELVFCGGFSRFGFLCGVSQKLCKECVLCVRFCSQNSVRNNLLLGLWAQSEQLVTGCNFQFAGNFQLTNLHG